MYGCIKAKWHYLFFVRFYLIQHISVTIRHSTYRSNGTQDAVPHDCTHVVHKFHGGGPGIHACSDDIFNRCVVVGMQLRRPRIKSEE